MIFPGANFDFQRHDVIQESDLSCVRLNLSQCFSDFVLLQTLWNGADMNRLVLGGDVYVLEIYIPM